MEPRKLDKWSSEVWWVKAKCGWLEPPEFKDDRRKCRLCSEKLTIRHILFDCSQVQRDTTVAISLCNEWIDSLAFGRITGNNTTSDPYAVMGEDEREEMLKYWLNNERDKGQRERMGLFIRNTWCYWNRKVPLSKYFKRD